jgi:hypothetical protein
MELNDHLHPRFAFWFAAGWTGVLGVGIYFNGGLGRINNPTSLVLASIACGALFTFFFGALVSERFRAIILRPDTDFHAVRRDLALVSFIGFVLLFGCVFAIFKR